MKAVYQFIEDGILWTARDYNENGEFYYQGSYQGKSITYHRYVWEKHNGPIPDCYIIHHKDNNKLNNDISNLMCVTPSEHLNIHKADRFVNTRKNKKGNRRVQNIDTGRIYKTFKEAAEDTEAPYTCILYAVYGKRKTAGGYRWQLVG